MPVCLHNATVLTGFAAMKDCAVLIEDGRIADVFSEKRLVQKKLPKNTITININGAYIAPGFIDTHIHGLCGFGCDDACADSVLKMSKDLLRYGVTAFNPTIYPCNDMPQTVSAIAAAIGKESGARIMGLHLEGPFLSPEKAGVQKPEKLKAVDIGLMERLIEAANGHIVNMTLAPELKGMRDLAIFCIKKGIVLQAGHTNAQYENMAEAMQVGILHSTHLFNAMSKMDHHNPNAVGSILIHPEFSCEIIADGFHVHPDLFKLLLRDKPADKIVLVTDSIKAANQKDGVLCANGQELVFHDGVFHRKSDDVIAGSALTMIEGVRNLVRFGFSLEDAVKAASSNPARIMRYTELGCIIPGYYADLVVFDADFNIKAAIVGGVIKYEDGLIYETYYKK
ncbi:MAG: N-acetylglucosamine-6-phosphate deacetylase [Spirochaetaceae bacterium]|nr:N-acetylglucosamine-6-phosphate deacetylase [Spirochaetaceae bacterium]